MAAGAVIQEAVAPLRNQNGEPGGSPFQRFNFRRRGAD